MERGGQCHVALRKESVDRNFRIPQQALKAGVALRKESVDRNPYRTTPTETFACRRSPQGERG
mgnify:CR=1 FL=1